MKLQKDFSPFLRLYKYRPTIKNTTDVNYKAIRWNDIKIFLERQTGKTEIGEFLRVSFLDLLSHLKVDRKLINGNNTTPK